MNRNRLGLFFFILSLFGFSTLSSLGIFANERLLFMRERANGYYSPIAYFLSKVSSCHPKVKTPADDLQVMFDIIPLRVIPPFVLGSIVYGLAGLNPEVSSFWKFIMTLVLFNLTASSIVLFLSVAISDLGLANLLGSLVMLYKWVCHLPSPSFFPSPISYVLLRYRLELLYECVVLTRRSSLLFAGLLMNYDRVPTALKWMQTLSFFHAGYEALLVNELRYLQLIEHKASLFRDSYSKPSS